MVYYQKKKKLTPEIKEKMEKSLKPSDNNQDAKVDDNNNDVKDNNDDDEDFDDGKVDIPQFMNDAADPFIYGVYMHLFKYFKTETKECCIYSIEMTVRDDKFYQIMLSNFNVFCPCLLGEYAAIYHPQSINGKFMKLYQQKNDENTLDSRVNLGFIQLFTSEIAKDIIIIDQPQQEKLNNIKKPIMKKKPNNNQ